MGPKKQEARGAKKKSKPKGPKNQKEKFKYLKTHKSKK